MIWSAVSVEAVEAVEGGEDLDVDPRSELASAAASAGGSVAFGGSGRGSVNTCVWASFRILDTESVP